MGNVNVLQEVKHNLQCCTKKGGSAVPCCLEGQEERVHQIPGGPTSYSSASGTEKDGSNANVVNHRFPIGFHAVNPLDFQVFPHHEDASDFAVPVPSARDDFANHPLQDVPTPMPLHDYGQTAAWHSPPDPLQARATDDFMRLIAVTKGKMISEVKEKTGTNKGSMYGGRDTKLPAYTPGKHVPCLALINPKSGAKVGKDVLSVARHCLIHQHRFFNVIDTVKDTARGGLLDVLRLELTAAKEEAKQMKPPTRPRIISGGGDGTGSFTLHMIFKALQADNSRAADGLGDTGNGFIWTDKEMQESFPAIAQMPLGSANDFANISGWGQKFPGSVNCCRSSCAFCSVFVNRRTKAYRFSYLVRWMEVLMDPATQVVNFDVWGIMPAAGATQVNFKLAELGGKPGRNPKTKVDGKWQFAMKQAGMPTPFFVLLYFSTGFGGQLISRFNLNRRSTPFRNRLEYIRQVVNMVFERVPPQINLRTGGVKVDCSVNKGADGEQASAYFPPRRAKSKNARGHRYREVGFYNINWQAHALHGADRAPLMRRCCWSKNRRPVKFNDGLIDMYRMRFKSYLKNPGTRMQTDKKKDMLLTFEASQGKGIFVQYDGEGRFAFSPTGDRFMIYIRKVLTIPLVVGPHANAKIVGDLKDEPRGTFEMYGETPEQKEQVRFRVLKSLRGDLDKELNATAEEMTAAKLPLYKAPYDHVNERPPAPSAPKKFHNAN